MPKVLITVTERVTYSREVEMTNAEYLEWDRKTDQRGRAGDDATEELTEKFIRRSSDWQSADCLCLSEFSLLLSDDAN